MTEPDAEKASASANAPPSPLLPLSTARPTHRSTRSHITLPHLSPRPDLLLATRRSVETNAEPPASFVSVSASPTLSAVTPPTAAVPPFPNRSSVAAPAVGTVSSAPSSARSHALLFAPTSHTARSAGHTPEIDGAASAQPSHASAPSTSSTAASVMSYLRTLTGQLSTSVSPRPISPDTPDSPPPFTPVSPAHQPTAPAAHLQPVVSDDLRLSFFQPQPQQQQHVYDITPSSTPRRHSVTPSTRSTSRHTTPRQHVQMTQRRVSSVQEPPSAQQRIFSALDYDDNGFIGTQDLLRAVRAVRGRAAGGSGSGSERGSGGRSEELLVECMMSMASMDDAMGEDDEDEADVPSGQISFVEFQRMRTKHWPTALVSQ